MDGEEKRSGKEEMKEGDEDAPGIHRECPGRSLVHLGCGPG